MSAKRLRNGLAAGVIMLGIGGAGLWLSGMPASAAEGAPQADGVRLAQAQNQQRAAAQGRGRQAAQPVQNPSLSLDQAMRALEAARQEARRMDLKRDIAQVDAGANLKAFARMDGAWLGSIDIAIKKARTARLFDMPTGNIGQLSQPGEALYMIEVSNDGLITFPGGLPIKDGQGNVIGAIGVSGSSVENDRAVAQAGVQALQAGQSGGQ